MADMTEGQLRNAMAKLYTAGRDDLVDAGVIAARGPTAETDWQRFIKNLPLFILKLPTERRQKLVEMING